MAIMNKVSEHLVEIKTPIDIVVDELVEIAKAKVDASWDNITEDSISKIHADIMSDVFIKLGKRMMKL